VATYTAAIAGCGRIAGAADAPRADGPVGTHAQAYRRHPSFRLAAACDPRGDRLEAFRRTWDVPRAYGSLAELLRHETPDVVSVCTPTAEHYDQIAALLAAPSVRVVFAEKPLCERPEQLEALERLAGRRPEVAVLVNHTRRFDPAHRRAAALVRSGALGPLVGGRCDYYGGWLHNGSHLVDTLRMLLGPVRVDGMRPGAPGRPDDPCPNVTLRAGDARIDAFGFDESLYQLFETDLRFSRGRVTLQRFGEVVAVERVATNAIGERYLEAVDGSPWQGLESPLLRAIEAIAAHLDGQGSLAATGATLDDAAQTMGVLWQAVERR
jgi:predicted dehydrogenase